MNIIVIWGSPHLNGSTASLVNAFISGVRSRCEKPPGAVVSGSESGSSFCPDIEIFSVYDMDIRPCTDCGLCENEDVCQYSGLDGFDSAIRRCDGIIIASPVYHATFPAPLKALFDRTQRYYFAYKNHRPLFAGPSRPAAVLLTAGQAKETGEVIKGQLRWILPSLNSHISEFLTVPGTNCHPVNAAMLSEAERSGKRFFSQVLDRSRGK